MVSDKNTKVPLPGASIVILNTNPQVGTVTDEQGRFRFNDVPIGRISLRVSFIGYADAAISNIDLLSGRELVLDVQLEEMAIPVDEVVVKANAGKDRPVNKLSLVSARSFTVEETERYAGSRGDVARMAANYAGVLGVDDSRNDIIIRGNSPMGLLWRLEGVDIPNPNHWGATGTTGGPVSMLNNNLLENSDFLTGAFSAEYGNAVSGVFDLRLRNGNNEKYEFLGQVGFNGFEFGAEGPVSRSNGSSFIVNYRYSTLGVFDKLGMDLGTTGVPYYQNLTFKVNFPKTRIGNISVFGLGGISDIELWDSRRDTLKNKIDFYGGEGFDLTNGSDIGVIGFNHSYSISPSTYSRLTLSYHAHRYQTILDSLSKDLSSKFPYYRNDFVDDALFANFFIHHRFSSKSTLRMGAIVRRMGYNFADSAYKVLEDRFFVMRNDKGNACLYQPYANWQIKPTNKLTLNLGLHYMYFALNQNSSLEPRVAIRWSFNASSAVSIGYGLHSQVVSLPIVLGRVRLPDNTSIQPNTDLGFIRSHHLVVGYDWLLAANTRLKAEVYSQRIFNAAVNATSSNSYSILNQGASFYNELPDYVKGTGTGNNYGIELTLERFLAKGLYYLVTTSIFQSQYRGSDGILHNTAFNQ